MASLDSHPDAVGDSSVDRQLAFSSAFSSAFDAF